MRGSWRNKLPKIIFEKISIRKIFIGFSMKISKIENLENFPKKSGKSKNRDFRFFEIFIENPMKIFIFRENSELKNLQLQIALKK